MAYFLEGDPHPNNLPAIEELFFEGLLRKDVEHHLGADVEALADLVFDADSKGDEKACRESAVRPSPTSMYDM